MVLVNDNDGFRCKNINGQAYLSKVSFLLFMGREDCFLFQKK
jgi:hypothetical protein